MLLSSTSEQQTKEFQVKFYSNLLFVHYKKAPFRGFSHLMDFSEKNWGGVKQESVTVTLVLNPYSSKVQFSEFEL